MRPKTSKESHFRRAARIDTRELERGLRGWELQQREARVAIEDALLREYGGQLPESWHASRVRGRRWPVWPANCRLDRPPRDLRCISVVETVVLRLARR
jgi:hypothetical protein